MPCCRAFEFETIKGIGPELCGLPRIPVPRTWVYKSKKKGPELHTPAPVNSKLLLTSFGDLLSTHPRSQPGRFRSSHPVPASKALAW